MFVTGVTHCHCCHIFSPLSSHTLSLVTHIVTFIMHCHCFHTWSQLSYIVTSVWDYWCFHRLSPLSDIVIVFTHCHNSHTLSLVQHTDILKYIATVFTLCRSCNTLSLLSHFVTGVIYFHSHHILPSVSHIVTHCHWCCTLWLPSDIPYGMKGGSPYKLICLAPDWRAGYMSFPIRSFSTTHIVGTGQALGELDNRPDGMAGWVERPCPVLWDPQALDLMVSYSGWAKPMI